MKKYLYVLFCLISCVGLAQQSNTHGSVTDASGTTWLYATATATLQNPSGQPPINIRTGAKVVTSVVGNAGATGLFNLTVDRNDLIVPNGTTWIYRVCSVSNVCVDSQPVSVISSPQIITFSIPPGISVEGSQVTNTNAVSQLATPPAPQFGRIAIVNGVPYVYDVTTMTWSVIGATQAQVVAAISGASIFPSSVSSTNGYFGAGVLTLTGTGPSSVAGNFSANGLFSSSFSSLGTSIQNTVGLQLVSGPPCSATTVSGSLFVCSSTATLPVTEPDSNYSVVCNINSDTSWASTVRNLTTTQFVVNVMSSISGGGSSGGINCIVAHN